MFGYVTINKPELKIKDYERYHAYYCGLCRCLKEKYGRAGQMTLTYDMTFLIILLTSLYEDTMTEEKHRCIVHPKKRHMIFCNEITEYAAAMNIALSYYHFLDDWEDERKVSGLVGKQAFARKYKKIRGTYQRQCIAIEEALDGLSKCEKETIQKPEEVSKWFGKLMSELLVYREDAFSPVLKELGDSLGRFIYLMDAYMDLEKDLKKGCYNPFARLSQEKDYQEQAEALFMEQMTRATIAFEKLPLELDVCILRNILYEGVYIKYERKQVNDK